MVSRGLWTVTSRWREIMRDNDDYIARNHVRVMQRTRDVTVTVTVCTFIQQHING
jgi:hypothetical protein